MEEVEQIVNQHYAQEYNNRFEDCEEEETYTCKLCGYEIKKEQNLCNSCQRDVQEQFKKLMKDNFNKVQIEHIDKLIDGTYLVNYLGMEE